MPILLRLQSVAVLYSDSYRGLPNVGWVVAGVVLLNTAGRMVSTFLALYLSISMQLSSTWIGLIVGAFGAGAIIGAIVGGRLCAKVSTHAIMIASLVGTSVGYIGLYFVNDPVAFMTVLFFGSCFEGAFRPAMNVVILETAKPSDRPRCYALYQVSLNLGYAIGAAAGGVISAIQFSLIFWVDGLTGFLAALCLLFWGRRNIPSSPADPDEQPSRSGSPWRSPAFLILTVVAILYYLVLQQRLATYPLYLVTHYGFDSRGVGILFAVNAIMIGFAAVFVADRLKAVDHRLTAAIGVLLLCGGFAVLPFGDTQFFVFLAMIVMTVGEMLFLPAFMGLVYACADGKRAGEFMGILLSISATCRVVGPMAGIWIAESFGNKSLWAACGALGIIAAAFLFLPVRRRLT